MTADVWERLALKCVSEVHGRRARQKSNDDNKGTMEDRRWDASRRGSQTSMTHTDETSSHLKTKIVNYIG